MTSFKDFLLENQYPNTQEIQSVLPHPKLLIRGLTNSTINSGTVLDEIHVNDDAPAGCRLKVIKKPVRLDRQPLHSPMWTHLAVDNWFMEKFGVKPRSQGLFAFVTNGEEYSQVLSSSGMYGTVSFVRPEDGFSYIWSPTITDLLTKIDDDTPEEKIPEILERGEYRFNEGLNEAPEGTEIVFFTKSYVAYVPVDMNDKPIRRVDSDQFRQCVRKLKHY